MLLSGGLAHGPSACWAEREALAGRGAGAALTARPPRVPACATSCATRDSPQAGRGAAGRRSTGRGGAGHRGAPREEASPGDVPRRPRPRAGCEAAFAERARAPLRIQRPRRGAPGGGRCGISVWGPRAGLTPAPSEHEPRPRAPERAGDRVRLVRGSSSPGVSAASRRREPPDREGRRCGPCRRRTLLVPPGWGERPGRVDRLPPLNVVWPFLWSAL